MTPTVYFLHGRDSRPQSRKIECMTVVAKRCGWRTLAPDFTSTKDPDERVRMFLTIVQQENRAKSVIVGSSMGGYVALVASKILKPDALLLLAPAINMPGYKEKDIVPMTDETTIVHGWGDNLISPAVVTAFAEKHRSTLHLVNDDHVLQQSIPFIEKTFHGILQRCNPISRQSRLVSTL